MFGKISWNGTSSGSADRTPAVIATPAPVAAPRPSAYEKSENTFSCIADIEEGAVAIATGPTLSYTAFVAAEFDGEKLAV